MDEKGEFFRLAQARRREGRVAEAEEILLKALEVYPKDPFLTCGLADLYVRQNRLLEAEELISGVMEQDPEYRLAFLVLGNLALKREQYAEAVRYFEAAYRQKPDQYSRIRLVEANLRQGEYETALTLVKQGLEQDPDNLALYRLLGRVQEKRGDAAGAREAYRRVLELDPSDQFCYQRFLQLESKDRPAQEVVREVGRIMAVGDRRENPHLRAWRARELKELGRWEEALAEYRRARELDPGNLFLQKQEGFCLYRMNRLEEALAIFREALRRDPRDHVLRKTLLATYRKLGRLREAVTYLEELLREHPDYKPLHGILHRIRREVQKSAAGKEEGDSDG